MIGVNDILNDLQLTDWKDGPKLMQNDCMYWLGNTIN